MTESPSEQTCTRWVWCSTSSTQDDRSFRCGRSKNAACHDAPVAHALPGIDPEIERIIHACLERDPAERPASAVAIAALLPGGDPLAAAIAKGVVPSPEMVAAAGPKGALHPAQAWALLGAIVVGTLAIATQAHVMNVAPSDVPKPPEVLAERARNILAGVGADDVEMDSAFWFAFDASRASPSGASRSAEITANDDGRTKVTFVYRQSPRRLVPQNVFRLVTDVDPPSDVPGMATLTLDPQGRLVRFTRVVPQRPASLRRTLRPSTGRPCLARLGWTSANSWRRNLTTPRVCRTTPGSRGLGLQR